MRLIDLTKVACRGLILVEGLPTVILAKFGGRGYCNYDSAVKSENKNIASDPNYWIFSKFTKGNLRENLKCRMQTLQTRQNHSK